MDNVKHELDSTICNGLMSDTRSASFQKAIAFLHLITEHPVYNCKHIQPLPNDTIEEYLNFLLGARVLKEINIIRVCDRELVSFFGLLTSIDNTILEECVKGAYVSLLVEHNFNCNAIPSNVLALKKCCSSVEGESNYKIVVK